jgi:NAD(P)-dependent dehydrogenase (short-subunit alcohol dehydrogenase family)
MSSDTSASTNTAIITGGASGIGQAIVAVLLERGWRVAIFDLEGGALASAREQYAGRDDVRLDAVDVTDEALITDTAAAVDADFGAITGLVNCAGIANLTPFFDTSADEFRKVLDVNVVGTFNAGKAAALRMRERGHGAIVNIASISGLRGSLSRSAYGASKGAVVTLTQVMAVDLAEHGLRVNAIAPGPIETPMVKAAHTDVDRRLYHRYVPMARYGAPSEIATVAAFLLDGSQSGYVTGEIIAVDGGYRGAGLIDRD